MSGPYAAIVEFFDVKYQDNYYFHLKSTSVEKSKLYWKTNLRYLTILLAIWFAVSYGCGILFADQLNMINIAGFPLGFWFAQQGAIYVFVALIFIYVYLMNKLDKKHGFDEI